MSYERGLGVTNDVLIIDSLNKYVTWGTVNLIWSPVPQVNTGLELIYTARKTMNPNPKAMPTMPNDLARFSGSATSAM